MTTGALNRPWYAKTGAARPLPRRQQESQRDHDAPSVRMRSIVLNHNTVVPYTSRDYVTGFYSMKEVFVFYEGIKAVLPEVCIVSSTLRDVILDQN